MRRRLTLRRIDPWSVLKFGFVANLSLLAIGLFGGVVVWFFIRRLQLIEKVCGIATDVGFETCAVNGANLFRAVLLLGLLGVVIMTGLLVFLAFLANLISDLTGGLTFSMSDDTAGREPVRSVAATGSTSTAAGSPTATRQPPARSANEPARSAQVETEERIFGDRPGAATPGAPERRSEP